MAFFILQRLCLRITARTFGARQFAYQGAGNVAIYATEKAQQLGAKVVTMADSTGWIYDAEGIDLDAIKEIKEVKRQRLTEYKNYRPTQSTTKANSIGQLSVMLHFHVLHRMSLTKKMLKRLIANGCYAVAEGANMPTTLEATKLLQEIRHSLCTG